MNVTVPSLSQLKHTFTVTFEYTDNVGTILVATFIGEAGLSFSGQNLPLISINGVDWLQQDYLKAENIQPSNRVGNADGGFGGAINMNEESTILAVGDLSENSDVAAFNGDTSDKGHRSGAVYIFKRNINWDQQAHIKASNPDTNDVFGGTVSLSDDGNALAVGAFGGDGGSIGINGNKGNASSPSGMANETEGAVYLY